MPEKLITYSFSQETACTAWNLKACCHVHGWPPQELSTARRIETIPRVCYDLCYNHSPVYVYISSSDPFYSGFPTKTLYVFPISPIFATCHNCPIHL
jgi:hypothetical protein